MSTVNPKDPAHSSIKNNDLDLPNDEVMYHINCDPN